MDTVENWSKVGGVLRRTYLNPRSPGRMVWEIEVDKIAEVGHYCSLVRRPKDGILPVNLPEHLAREFNFQAGSRVELVVRQSGPHEYEAHPDPVSVTGAPA